MKFYTLLASRYFELRILLDNVKSHKLQLVQFFVLVLVGFFVLHSWFLSVTSWSSGGGGGGLYLNTPPPAPQYLIPQ